MTRRAFLGASAALGAAALGYSAISNELEVTHSRAIGRSLAAGLRIAVATDMHAPHDYIDQRAFSEAVRRFDPHLMCVVGDAIERRGTEALVRFYDDTTARLGKFAVYGNWEYYGRIVPSVLSREYERAGFRLLLNEKIRLDYNGRPIDLIGLDDLLGGAPDYSLGRMNAGDAPDTPAIVLSHCPLTFDRMVPIVDRPIQMLAGHTHGGQIAPFGWAPVRPWGSGRYVAGWYAGSGGSALYVSRGLGNSGAPFRIGSRPELALLTF